MNLPLSKPTVLGPEALAAAGFRRKQARRGMGLGFWLVLLGVLIVLGVIFLGPLSHCLPMYRDPWAL